MSVANISQFDIARLMSEPSPTVRAEVAGTIARDFSAGHFKAREAELALDILTLLAKDSESRVRRVIAEKLKANLTLPHALVLAFANDVADVALPILEYSYVLTEEDLIAVVEEGNSFSKRLAIAKRETISAGLADALIGTANEQIIRTVCANSGASLSEESIMKVLGGFGYDQPILEALTMRADLPYSVAALLFTRVRDELKEHLTQQYKLITRVAAEEPSDARELAQLGVVPPPTVENMEQMVEGLFATGALTDSMVIRALCTGNLAFFEVALARLADVHPINARMLMLDASGKGFAALYEAAGLAPGFYDAVYTLHSIMLEESGYGRFRRADHKKRVLSRLVREGHDHAVENMPYLMSLIGAAQGEEALAA